jgi:PRTRC genetic system protein B
MNIESDHSEQEAKLTPGLALIFYHDTGGRAYPYKLPLMPMGEDEFTFGAAIQGSADDLRVLRQCLDGGITLHHEHVLSNSSGVLLWWVPAAPRELMFGVRVTAAAGIQKLNGQAIPQPPLLMLTQGRTLYVFALAENKRPDVNTKLYKAPYWNMFENGQMCMGTVKLPDVIDAQHPEAITDRFFRSNFSGASRQNISNHSRSHQEMWEDAAKRGAFDPAWLVEEQKIKTVKELMSCQFTR